MPKLSQSLQFTMRVGPPELNQYAKLGVEISEIDTAIPIEQQLTETQAALEHLWRFTVKVVTAEIKRIKELNGS